MRASYFIPVPSSFSLWGMSIQGEDIPRFVHPDSWRPLSEVCPHCGGPAVRETFTRERGHGLENVSMIRCKTHRFSPGMTAQLGCPTVEVILKDVSDG